MADVDIQCRAVAPVRALDGQGLHRGEDAVFGGCCCKGADRFNSGLGFAAISL